MTLPLPYISVDKNFELLEVRGTVFAGSFKTFFQAIDIGASFLAAHTNHRFKTP